MTIADRLAVFMDGRIVQVGTPAEVFARPATIAVAGIIGSPPMNLLAGEAHGDRLTIAGVAMARSSATLQDGPVTIGVRPGAVRLAEQGLPARVYLIEDLGDSAIVDLQVGEAIVKMRTDGQPTLREGDAVHLAFEPSAVHVFDPASGLRR